MGAFPNMARGSKGWNSKSAYFKAEGTGQGVPQINIGLGYGRGLETFNADILGFTKVR